MPDLTKKKTKDKGKYFFSILEWTLLESMWQLKKRKSQREAAASPLHFKASHCQVLQRRDQNQP